ncbi:MAG: hypothetical protein Q4F84_01415 [Fibrobacter sp.]|nr:hypothetical protein [Fibrobacter sp.]
MCRTFSGILILIFAFKFGFAQSEAAGCSPVVEIYRAGFGSRVCFNEITQAKDSCVDLSINFDDIGLVVKFHRTRLNSWQYVGIDSKNDNFTGVMKVDVTFNADGSFNGAILTVVPPKDSMATNMPLVQVQGDRVSNRPQLAAVDYSISESHYLCTNTVRFITDRKFTFPPGYMRRDQRLNHAELSMFHSGKSVRMPTSASVRERGILIFEYKVLNPGKLTYDNPDEIEKKEAWKNKFKKREKKKKEKRTRKIKINLL